MIDCSDCEFCELIEEKGYSNNRFFKGYTVFCKKLNHKVAWVGSPEYLDLVPLPNECPFQ